MYQLYEKKQKEALNTTEPLKGRHNIYKTPTLKYLTGTLVLSDFIKGEKEYGVTLIE